MFRSSPLSPQPPSRKPPARLVALTATALATVGLAISASPAAAAPPANDHFADAATIALDAGGNGGSTNGTTIDATFEPGEPLIRSENSGSVWYKITPTIDVPLVIDTCSAADFDTMLGVYTGNGVSALSTVAQNDDSECDDNRSQVNIAARAGTTYWIQVRGYGSADGTFTLRVAPGLLPPDIYREFGNPVNPALTPLEFDFDDEEDRIADTGAQCRIDDGPAEPCEFPYVPANATELAEGPHTLQVVLTYGGYTSPPDNVSFTVDRTPPTVTVTSGPADGAAQPLPLLWHFATDGDAAGFECTVDGLPVRCDGGWTGPTEISGGFDDLCAGPHVLTFVALDDARNRSTPIRRTVTATDGAPCAAPTFTDAPSYGTSPTWAWGNVDVDPHGAGARVFLEYGTTTAYGERADAIPGPPTSGGSVGVELDFLMPGTTYHARWVAENATGRTVGDPFTFATPTALGPALITSLLPVTGLGTTTATLNATVPSNRWSMSRFEYGTSTAYGTRVLAPRRAGRVVAELTDLTPSTTYHYRLLTVDGDTATLSPDATFTTTAEGTVPPIDSPPVDGPPVRSDPPFQSAPPIAAPAPAAQAKQYLADALKRVKLTRKQLRKGGTVTVRVKTIGAGTVKLSGKLRRGKAKKAVALGSGSAKAKKAGTAKVRLKIAKQARSQARRKGKLTVTLTARFAGSGVKQTSTSRTIKLR